MLIDRSKIEKEIKKVYKRGHSVDGRPAYSGLLLFKMLLLGIWYDLSDERVEKSVNENLSMMRFCDLDIEDSVPDHSVLAECDDGLAVEWFVMLGLAKTHTQYLLEAIAYIFTRHLGME